MKVVYFPATSLFFQPACPDVFPGYPCTCKQVFFTGVSVTVTAFYLFPGFFPFQVKQFGAFNARILETSCEHFSASLYYPQCCIANRIHFFSFIPLLCSTVLAVIPSVSVPSRLACLLRFLFFSFKDFSYNLSVLHS